MNTFFPMNDPETVLLIDSWKDQTSLDIHHGSPMMGTIAALREKYDLHMRAERYVSDDAGISDADKNLSKNKPDGFDFLRKRDMTEKAGGDCR